MTPNDDRVDDHDVVLARALQEIADLRAEAQALKERLEVVGESERQYRTLVESAKDFIFIVDRQGLVRYVNEFAASSLRMRREQIVGRPIAELFPSNASRQAESMRQVLVTGTPLYVETVTQFPNGPLCLDTWLIPLTNRNDEIDLVLGISRDITERKVALDELKYRIAFEETIASISRQFISAPIEKLGAAMTDAVRVLGEFLGADRCSVRIMSEDSQRVDVTYVWRAPGPAIPDFAPQATAKEWPWGFSVLQAQRTVVILSPADLPEKAVRERRLMAESGIQSFAVVPLVYGGETIGALSFTSRAGVSSWSTQAESLLGVAGEIFTNALVRKRFEEDRAKIAAELIRAERLDSIGILAGGIAHDFNNILAAIWGNVSLAKAELKRSAEVSSRLGEAEKALGRARDLTQQLLTFAKGGSPVKQVVELGSLAMESAVFATRGSNVRPSFDMEDALWPVEADTGQVAQVVHNLVINAVQAMPDGGVVDVAARNVALRANSGIPLVPGKYVRVTVSDQGTGIAQENLSKLFVPYFTTKPSGSGLGLATSYNIVRKHAGLITVNTHQGEGSQFSVYLPASNGTVTSSTSDEAMVCIGTGRVLVVDDDEAIRTSATAMLSHLGYEAAVATTGEDAIAMYEEASREDRRYHAVIMDLTIPGSMGGDDAIARILAFDPDALAIVSSGYSESPVMASYGEYGFRGVLRKPYGLRQLGEVLQALLVRRE